MSICQIHLDGESQRAEAEIRGPLTHETAPVIGRTVKRLLQRGLLHLAIDLSEASPIDIAGLATLVHWLGRCRQEGIDLKLLGLPPPAVELCQIYMIEALLAVEEAGVQGDKFGEGST